MIVWVIGGVAALLLCRMYLNYSIGRCTSQARLTGKVVIVTGSNAGIGFHIAKDLASRGARVIIACRNPEKGERARDEIIEETGNKDVVVKILDLGSLASVRKFAEDIMKTEKILDVLVNNAGMYGNAEHYTADGILETMQVNLFAPMLLVDLLLPLLKKSQPSRIVSVSSAMGYIGTLNVKKINKKGAYGNIRMYSNSKYCLDVLTVELARRLRGSRVTVNACHPGVARTTITDKGASWASWVAFVVMCWVSARTAADAAHTPLHLAVAEELEAASGGFYLDCARWPHAWGAQSKKKAVSLWEIAEKLLGHKFQNMNSSCF